MKGFLLATVARAFAVAFMSDVVETVTIKGKGGHPLRVNKTDYDADQAEGGAKSMTLHTNDADQSSGDVTGALPPGVIVPPAASAPDYTAGANTAPPTNIDPATGAATPSVPSPGQLLVSKEGTGAKTRVYVGTLVGNDFVKTTGRDGIDEKGYPDEKSAWDAIVAATPH